MVGHHLPVVLPPGLCVQDQHLVHVERRLGQVVKLDRPGKREMRVVDPNLRWIEGRRGQVTVDIL